MGATNPDTQRDYHDPADVFASFGEHGSPAIVGKPVILIDEIEDGFSVQLVGCDDGTVCLAHVSTVCAPEARRVSYIHLDRGAIMGAILPLVEQGEAAKAARKPKA